jgi:hypothetical protein
MRKFALCTALLAIFSAGTASAKNDFDALLGELTFGAPADSGAQKLTLDNIAANNLSPAPHAQVSAQQPITDPAIPEPQAEEMLMPQPDPSTDQIPVEQDPQPVAPAMTAPGYPEMPVTSSACEAPVAGPCCDTGQCCSHGRQSCHQCKLFKKNHCGCVPYTPPNLPTSSFYQYFKSNSCNCRVWDGYQNRCILASKHSRGECDCFAPRKKCSLSGLRCNGGSCNGGSCNGGSCSASTAACTTNGCHQLPACWSGGCDEEATCAAPSACDSLGCDH